MDILTDTYVCIYIYINMCIYVYMYVYVVEHPFSRSIRKFRCVALHLAPNCRRHHQIVFPADGVPTRRGQGPNYRIHVILITVILCVVILVIISNIIIMNVSTIIIIIIITIITFSIVARTIAYWCYFGIVNITVVVTTLSLPLLML